MKSLILIFGLVPLILNGQDKSEEKKVRISLNFFNPIQIQGNDKYYIENQLQEDFNEANSSPQIKKYKMIGFGIDVGYILKNEDCILLNFGFGQKTGKESLIISSENPVNHPNEVVNYGADIKYKQNNYSFSLFYQSKVNIKKFEIYGGIGLSYLLQGNGQLEETQWQSENVYINEETDSLNLKTKIIWAKGHSLGLGLRLGFAINLNKNLKIGADFTNYFYFTFYAPNSTREFKNYERRILDDGSGTGNLISVVKTNTSTTTKSLTEFRQYSFTNISPCLKLTYEF